MINQRTQVVVCLIGQRARSRKDLDNADETQEEEYRPYALVALEKIANFLFHSLFYFSCRTSIARISSSRGFSPVL